MEDWMTIPGFLGYSVSNLGHVRNDDTGRLLTILRNLDGVCYVGMMHRGVQRRRSLAPLVAERFVENTMPDRNDFDEVIHLDGNQTNNHADNLRWRPHWFVVTYALQMKRGPMVAKEKAIMDMDTRDIYYNPWEAATMFGLIERDIIMSINNRTFVWPTFQTFRFVED